MIFFVCVNNKKMEAAASSLPPIKWMQIRETGDKITKCQFDNFFFVVALLAFPPPQKKKFREFFCVYILVEV